MTHLPVNVEALIDGDPKALAKAISAIENQRPGWEELIGALHLNGEDIPIIGITGSPGAGKSTLVNELVSLYRTDGLTVGVLAIDPTSPYSGGAILGDRIRLSEHSGDTGVFTRSMSNRGIAGGLSPATGGAITAMEAFGFDRIIIETVGAGQSEVDIIEQSDSIVVVLQPQSGDDIQLLKAGILEIGDLFVVNKMDLPEGERTVREVHQMVTHLRESRLDWELPVVETIATRGDGIQEFHSAIESHIQFLQQTQTFRANRRHRYEQWISHIVDQAMTAYLSNITQTTFDNEETISAVLERRESPYEVAAEMLEKISFTNSCQE